ncbi:MAG: hypothetical protein WDN47_01310 [Candidatus Doudnabacteria bacterium]
MKILIVCQVRQLQQLPIVNPAKIKLWWVPREDVIATLSTEAGEDRPFDDVIVYDDGDVDFLVKALFIFGIQPLVVCDLQEGLREILRQPVAASSRFGTRALFPGPQFN